MAKLFYIKNDGGETIDELLVVDEDKVDETELLDRIRKDRVLGMRDPYIVKTFNLGSPHPDDVPAFGRTFMG
jgi:hypothetical protein